MNRFLAQTLLVLMVLAVVVPLGAFAQGSTADPTPPASDPAPAQPDTTPSAQAQTTETAQGQATNPDNSPVDSGFVPLTSVPGIQEAADSGDLSIFLNTVYKLCIGIAATLAVLQIVRGGITYMLGETSVVEKREAMHHINLAIFGLILVLSPAIIFGIINKDILDLKIDVGGLTPQRANEQPVAPDQPVNGALSDGSEFPIGSRVSCLYPGGGVGNKPGTVVARTRNAVSAWLLTIHFDGGEGVVETTASVAPGDCHGLRVNATDVARVSSYSVGDSVYCQLDPPKYSPGTVREINTTRGWLNVQFHSTRTNMGASSCFHASTEGILAVCGTPPNCNAGCGVVQEFSASGDRDICEPN